MEKIETALVEKLADIEHQRWAGWHKYSVKNWNLVNIERWNRQAETPYVELSESEKESDRREVMRYFPIIQEYVKSIEEATAGKIKRVIQEYGRTGNKSHRSTANYLTEMIDSGEWRKP